MAATMAALIVPMPIWNQWKLKNKFTFRSMSAKELFHPDSAMALYGCSDLQLGSQLATPPDFRYLWAYWSGPKYDFVSFLVGVKKKYDSKDLFKFAQSIPVEEPPRPPGV